MPGLIEEGSGKVLGRLVTLVELFGRYDFIEEHLWHWLARLVMFCKIPQHLRPGCPHFVNLGRILDEIARHARAAEPRILHIGEHSMQGVTELMKGGPDFVVGEKSWLTRRRFGNVEVIRHHR